MIAMKKNLTLFLSTALILGLSQNGLENVKLSQATVQKISNPGVANDITTWDTVYFGHYWQNDTNGDDKADQTDEKEPIRWRVLSVEENDAFLLADSCLDCQPYNETNTETRWDTCTLRSWLNGYGSESNAEGIDYTQNNFINAAFTPAEQMAIKETTVIDQGIENYFNGNDTIDQIYLLSHIEASNPNYGFAKDSDVAYDARIAAVTPYFNEVCSQWFSGYQDAAVWLWWLRTQGVFHPLSVSNTGRIDNRGHDDSISRYAIRPVLHLDLTLTELYSFGETISSDGTQGKPIPTVIPSPSPSPETTNKPTASPGGESFPENTTSPDYQEKPLQTTIPSVAPTASPTAIPSVVPSSVPTAKATVNPITSFEQNITSVVQIGQPIQSDELPIVETSQPEITKPVKVKSFIVKNGGSKSINLAWKKVSEATGYQIYYSVNKNFKKKAVKNTFKTKLTVKKLKKKKTYYFKIRAYVTKNGKKTYGKWSKIKSVKVK